MNIFFKFALVVFSCAVLIPLVLSYSNSPNTCSVVPGTGNVCNFGDIGLFSVHDPPYGASDTHVAVYTNASDPNLQGRVCCTFNSTVQPYFTTGFCPQGAVFSAFDVYNSHIASNRSGGAQYNLCAVSGDGYAKCTQRYTTSGCYVGETCIGSFDSSNPGNSHLGACNAMGINLCCSFNTSITLPGVQIAGFDYYCGTADGVCPQKFYNASGSTVNCDLRPDPDC